MPAGYGRCDSCVPFRTFRIAGSGPNNNSGARPPRDRPGGGGPLGGGGPQDAGPPNDCLVFAAMVDIFAAESSSESSFVNTLYERFKDRNDQSFSANGFKEDFVDRGDSPNQVRHSAGAISAGYAGGVTALATLNPAAWGDAAKRTTEAFNMREKSYKYEIVAGLHGAGVRRVLLPPTKSQQADMNLNGVAVPLGFMLGVGLIERGQVGNLIRERICNPQ